MDNLRNIIRKSQETIRFVNKLGVGNQNISYEKGQELRKAREDAKNRIYFARNLLSAMVNE